MSEGAKCLSPDHAKVTGSSIINLGETAIEDVCKYDHAECSDDRFTTFVVAIGDVAEKERNRNLSDRISHLYVATFERLCCIPE